MSVRHGGNLQEAVQRWARPYDQWLDLSTGINPWPWPVPSIPAACWQRLPEERDGLNAAIQQWAGVSSAVGLCPLAGSQAAIQALPRLRPAGRVGVPVPGYQEHGHCWAAAGHQVVALPQQWWSSPLLDTLDVVVSINPNNPTGAYLPVSLLADVRARLAARGGWLVVDEAFLLDSANSVIRHSAAEGLVVLKSLGKFFGLAGLRAGVALGDATLMAALQAALGPWAVSGPARYVMAEALADEHWQTQARARLTTASARLTADLDAVGLASQGTELFRYCPTPAAMAIADQLAAQGIWVRTFDVGDHQPPALRLGLPGSEQQWQRLKQALARLVLSGPSHHSTKVKTAINTEAKR
ncbi:threonine-phosphate decarboxylase [Terasakiispira papahanaumokuakeensis]|uniref:threonine-phosphate decarboxylase n=1 Tax=Terasakiispira papahanaumokuakeensis TaxID=197479 RepID=A0A1E2VCA3_9GAMM|nr:threonine-phosphate decarboxylase CobD [Terasakiispira papahanaumokuakeensis]ODC04611.1 threonine-phosphate decarboxylase [Terasakiispira papahanaumokuakeensis]